MNSPCSTDQQSADLMPQLGHRMRCRSLLTCSFVHRVPLCNTLCDLCVPLSDLSALAIMYEDTGAFQHSRHISLILPLVQLGPGRQPPQQQLQLALSDNFDQSTMSALPQC